MFSLAVCTHDLSVGAPPGVPQVMDLRLPGLSSHAASRPTYGESLSPNPLSIGGARKAAGRLRPIVRPKQLLGGARQQVVATLLAPTSAYASTRTDIRIAFDGPVDRLEVARQLRIEPAVAGTVEWLDAGTVRFQPEKLAFETTYQVQLSGTGGFGNGTWVWAFTTIKPLTLTFDDCPTTPAQLNSLLALLAQRHIHAIMFPTGICAKTFPWMVPTMLAAGHRVCNHTFSHYRLTRLTDPQIAYEIANGVHAGCDLLRPPFGDWDGPNGRVARIAAQQGFKIFMWDMDSLDWGGVSASVILQQINARGGVILMHLQGAHTQEALRSLDLL
jgi:peptidoglycan/xylan/chitin deacetylase (PgdA/CDA1 family)